MYVLKNVYFISYFTCDLDKSYINVCIQIILCRKYFKKYLIFLYDRYYIDYTYIDKGVFWGGRRGNESRAENLNVTNNEMSWVLILLPMVIMWPFRPTLALLLSP